MGLLPAEPTPLAAAAGRVLRQSIMADRALPPLDRATLDGIAIASGAYLSGRTSFAVAGFAKAGAPQASLEQRSACFEIATGAPMPIGTDCVIRIEDVAIENGVAKVAADLPIRAGHGAHTAGSDCEAQRVLLEPGVVLTGKEIAVAASVGAATVLVSALPRIAIVTTGDELVPVDQAPEPYQIRRSNDLALAAALAAAGYPVAERVHIADDPAQIRETLAGLLQRVDAIVLGGGVSKGKLDFVPQTLDDLDIERRLQWVRQRPGKPMWFGQYFRQREAFPIFALPGNPVSCFTCLRRYVIPALDKWSGKKPAKIRFAKIAQDLTFKPEVTLFLPVRVDVRPSGEIWAEPSLFNTSGDFVSVASTDGFLELPRSRSVFPIGEPFRYFEWPT